MGKLLLSLTILGFVLVRSESNAQSRVRGNFSNTRLIVKMRGPNGDTLHLVADTGGGGGIVIWEDVAANLHIQTEEKNLDGQKMKLTSFSSTCLENNFPLPNTIIDGTQKTFVIPQPSISYGAVQGMTGHKWFAGHTWKLDYIGKTILVDVPFVDRANDRNVVKLGFPEAAGKRQTEYPRFQIVVDKDTLQMLFDTGAMVAPTDSAKAKLHTTADILGTSFVIQSIMNKWIKNHPDWKIIRNADRNFHKLGMPCDMIEVPEVEIAGHKIGPVWFTSRPDKNFIEGMSRFMDKTIVGAIGGSAFQYFKITIDYPNALANFER